VTKARYRGVFTIQDDALYKLTIFFFFFLSGLFLLLSLLLLLLLLLLLFFFWLLCDRPSCKKLKQLNSFFSKSFQERRRKISDRQSIGSLTYKPEPKG